MSFEQTMSITRGFGRRLQGNDSFSLESFDVARDLVDVQFLLKSDIEPEDIEYEIGLKEWSQEKIEFKFNFSNPLLISQGEEQDMVQIKFKDRDMITFADGFDSLPEEMSIVTQKLPKQLPDFVDEESLEATSD